MSPGASTSCLRHKTAYSDAWSFDLSWLGKLYDAANMQQTFRLADISSLIDEEQRDRWHGVKLQVISDMGLRRHRASGDAGPSGDLAQAATEGRL